MNKQGDRLLRLILGLLMTLTCWGESSVQLIARPLPILSLSTPLGEDVLMVKSAQGREAISRLFRFQLDLASPIGTLGPRGILGQEVTLTLQLADGSPRYFNGFVSRFQAGDSDEKDRREYRAEIVPWLWFLTRTSDSRIFQAKSVPDVVEQIFEELGFGDFRFELEGTHPVRECLVQYRETDFNFVSRLLEEEGIFYFFEHTENTHTLVLADHKEAYRTFPGYERVAFFGRPFRGRAPEGITEWEHEFQFTSGRFTQNEYNFKRPEENLLTTAVSSVDLPGIERYELYDYPGGYENIGEGQAITQIRMEASDVRHDTASGQATARGLAAGHRFSLSEHPQSGENGDYLVVSTRFSALDPTVSHDSSKGAKESFQAELSVIPAEVIFRPSRQSRKPVISGVQTAVVTGPAGEEIFVDEFGRVKVKFYWDREGANDDTSSCWIRVQQSNTEEARLWIPEIGDEVLVSFLEGDPDRPVVLGRVFNGMDLPPPADGSTAGE